MTDIVDTFIAPPCHQEIELLHEDKSLLLISKPSGLLSLSGKNPVNKDSVHFRLITEFPTATLVHRLDFGTSGIMIVALDKQVNKHLTIQFQQRIVVKHYKAILLGHMNEDQGVIDMPIAKDNAIFPRSKICLSSGKPALTHYQVEERLDTPPRTTVIFKPETGRTHQLRIHAHAVGHPILGCDLYNTKNSQSLADRLLLHATSIEFVHPASGEKMHAICPGPF